MVNGFANARAVKSFASWPSSIACSLVEPKLRFPQWPLILPSSSQEASGLVGIPPPLNTGLSRLLLVRPMHPISLSPFLKPTLDALKAGLRAVRRKQGKRKYEQALSAAIKELLQQHPDINAAEAQLAAARATGVEPDPTLLRGEEMLRSARGHGRGSMAASTRTRWAARKGGARARKKPAKSDGRKRPARAKRKA